MNILPIIGRAEKISLPQLSVRRVPAKIDTGADASSIWAHKIKEKGDKLNVIFFGPESAFYDGSIHEFSSGNYSITRVSNSFGHREMRYKVKLKVRIKKRLINGTFTLADRSGKLYPILIGRSLLKKKFIVDVSKGKPLIKQEKARKKALKREIIKSTKE